MQLPRNGGFKPSNPRVAEESLKGCRPQAGKRQEGRPEALPEQKEAAVGSEIGCSRQTQPMSKPPRREPARAPGQEPAHVPTAQAGAVHVWRRAPLRRAGHHCPLCCCLPWPPTPRAPLIIDVRCLQRGPPPPRKAPGNKGSTRPVSSEVVAFPRAVQAQTPRQTGPGPPRGGLGAGLQGPGTLRGSPGSSSFREAPHKPMRPDPLSEPPSAPQSRALGPRLEWHLG